MEVLLVMMFSQVDVIKILVVVVMMIIIGANGNR